MAKKASGNFFYRVLCGAFLGISIIAPGISGSIMAVMMGIYDDLLEIVSNPLKNFKRNFIYILPMGIGAVLSIFLLLQVLDLLFEYYPTPAYLLFIGLIAGSMPTVAEEIRKPFKKRCIIGLVGAFAFAIAIGLLAKSGAVTTAATVSDTVPLWYLSVSGAIAGVTGMIPGMSVSMMLMMLGVYEPLLNAAANFDVLTAAPVAICFLIGMVLFSKLTKRIFTQYRNLAYFMVLGFMTGSVFNIFPALPVGLPEWLLSAAGIGVGVGISILFRHLGKKFKTGDGLSFI